MDRRHLRKWQRRIPRLATLIRIRKASIEAICVWDLVKGRPSSLRVIDTNRDLTDLTVEKVMREGGSAPHPAVQSQS